MRPYAFQICLISSPICFLTKKQFLAYPLSSLNARCIEKIKFGGTLVRKKQSNDTVRRRNVYDGITASKHFNILGFPGVFIYNSLHNLVAFNPFTLFLNKFISLSIINLLMFEIFPSIPAACIYTTLIPSTPFPFPFPPFPFPFLPYHSRFVPISAPQPVCLVLPLHAPSCSCWSERSF